MDALCHFWFFLTNLDPLYTKILNDKFGRNLKRECDKVYNEDDIANNGQILIRIEPFAQ